MTQPFETARQVSEYLLEKTGRAILAKDPDSFLPCFCLPTEIETFEGRRLIRTGDDLKRVFLAVRSHYDRIGVTDMVRHCVEAAFTDDETVVAMHETRLLSGNVLTRAPFATLSVLRYVAQDWRIASSCYAIDDHKEHNAALMIAGEICPQRAFPFRPA